MLWLALAAVTALRLVVAWATPMAPDEAYYWVWSRALAAGYYDHPPMVALFIRAGTVLAGESNLGVRLLAPVTAALGSVLLVRTGRLLAPGTQAGPWAAGLLNATLIMGVGATTMTPDTPLLLFWTATLWALAELQVSGRGTWWLVAGLAAGLALDSKYTAVLMAPAILAWLLWSPRMRPWLRRPHPYLGGWLALLIFTPVLWWNDLHGWISFAKQGGRAADWSPGRALQFLGELLGGQIGLATPLIAVLAAAGLGAAVRRARNHDAGWTLLACFTLIPLLVFVQHALGDRVQANWPAILFPSALLAAARLSGVWARLRPAALGLGVVLTAVVWVQAAVAPLALPMMRDPTLLRLGGWEQWAAQIDAEAARQGAAFIVADNYGQAALLARLLPKGRVVLGLDERWPNFDLPRPRFPAGTNGLLVRSARRADTPESPAWSVITRLPMIARSRNAMVAEEFRLYRVTSAAPFFELAVMPRPKDLP